MNKATLSDDVERLMTVEEIAAFLRIHPTTVYRLTRNREIPFMKLGGSYRYRKSAVVKAMEASDARKE